MPDPLDPLEPLPCFPDQFLTEEKLEAHYEEFRSGLRNGLPEAAIFSHLVGGVRQAYTVEIMDLLKEIIRRSDQYERRLSEIREHYESRLAGAPASSEQGGQESVTPTPPARGGRAFPAAWRAGEALPADPITIYVGSADRLARRDMLGFDAKNLEQRGWVARFEFKAFKYLEIGTVKVTAASSVGSDPHRMNVFLDHSGGHEPGWEYLMDFYAFKYWRPNTEMISVGYAVDPERCIFIRGDHTNKLPGWSEKFVFWVPV